MSKTKIYLYISEIASYIGQNKWDPITPFERLWKRCDLAGYNQTIEKVEQSITQHTTVLDGIEVSSSELEQKLQKKQITKREYKAQMDKLVKEKEQITAQITELKTKIHEIDLTQQQKLELAIGTDLVKDIQTNTKVETSEKRIRMSDAIEKSGLTDTQKQELKRQAESFVNKSHGTIKEDSAIAMYEKKFKVRLDTSQQFFKKRLDHISLNSSYDWYICGKMDGIYRDESEPLNNYVVEIKNRTRGFFSSLRDYEKTQVQLYLWMLDYPKAQLVEKYESKIRTTSIYRDQDYINNTLEYLDIFIDNFQDFLIDDANKCNYVGCDQNEKRGFLNRLYMSKIVTRINQKLAADDLDTDNETVNCDIDSV